MLRGSRHDSHSPASAGPFGGEEMLRAIIATSPECIKVVARDGRLLQMNPAGLTAIEADSWQSVEHACTFDLIAHEHRHDWIANHERVCGGLSISSRISSWIPSSNAALWGTWL